MFNIAGGITATYIAKWHDVGAGIEEKDTKGTINTFPNPTNNYITVTNQEVGVNTYIYIWNTEGILIKKEKATNTTTQQVYIGDLAVGVYYWGLQTKDGATGVKKKFVVVR